MGQKDLFFQHFMLSMNNANYRFGPKGLNKKLIQKCRSPIEKANHKNTKETYDSNIFCNFHESIDRIIRANRGTTKLLTNFFMINIKIKENLWISG